GRGTGEPRGPGPARALRAHRPRLARDVGDPLRGVHRLGRDRTRPHVAPVPGRRGPGLRGRAHGRGPDPAAPPRPRGDAGMIDTAGFLIDLAVSAAVLAALMLAL